MSNLTPYVTWRGRIASLCLALLLAVGIAARAVARPNPQDSVRSFYDRLLTTMKAGATLGERGRYARMAPVIDRLFDVPAMARLAVGPSWETLSPTQQQQVTEAFAHYITAT
jgi:phospholipid transport system substrate-binding protein